MCLGHVLCGLGILGPFKGPTIPLFLFFGPLVAPLRSVCFALGFFATPLLCCAPEQRAFALENMSSENPLKLLLLHA